LKCRSGIDEESSEKNNPTGGNLGIDRGGGENEEKGKKERTEHMGKEIRKRAMENMTPQNGIDMIHLQPLSLFSNYHRLTFIYK